MKKTIKISILIITLFSFINVYAKDGWVTEKGSIYYYENDVKISGFKQIEEKLYFFSRVTSELKYGWQNAKEGSWYQNENGEVLIGEQIIDKKKYLFDENGIVKTGFVTINDKTYFYSRVTGELKYGWQNANEGSWYQNQAGEVVKGLQNIKGNTYYFDDTTGIMYKGFKEIDGKLYFFSRLDGKLKYGWQNANEGYWYQNQAGEVVRGIQKLGNDTYYFDEVTGIMYKGFKEINGKLYFFSRANGKLKYGWQNTNEGYWYQNQAGEVVRGIQTIDGRDYHFDDTTGIVIGFKKINNKIYYYNPDGTQAKGIQYMMNQFWKFNEITGAFEKKVREIRTIDVSSHQGNIDWEKVKASGKVDAVILRLGYGVGYIDTKFVQNKNELERLGIPYSVYLFSYAENKKESLQESNFLINTLKNNSAKIASNIFAVYYDLEDWEIKSTGENSYGITKDTYGDMIVTFVENTEKNICIKTRVYASKNYIETRFPEEVQEYATWVAQWGDALTYKGAYEGWQYTNCEYIPGINGCVDMSKFYY